MKGLLRNIGVLGLACFSFLITDETIQVVKEKDELMIEIKSVASDYYIDAIDARINDKYIKIGLNGLELDINATYNKMKRIGYFNENMLVYSNVKPNITILNQKDKIINANSKNEISLAFINPTNINKIINILKNNGVKANVFINNEFYQNNFESLELLKAGDNNIGIIDDYNKLKNILNDYICYSNLIDNCLSDNKYTIEATYEINDLKDLKNNLAPGTIILIKDDTYLDIYIKYILSKGYKITNLSNFISEEIK
ncbi:MAG: hypothetical protein IJB71_03435 [Bacilli bacterium]|nr:hypothetical protein [Bacilli bacterium]